MTDPQFAEYEVPIWNAGWARSVLANAGIPIAGTRRQGDTIIIIIPAQYAGFDHTADRPKRRRWWRPSRKLIVTVAMLALAGVGLYMFLGSGVQLPAIPQAAPVAPAAPALTLPALPDPLAGAKNAIDGAVHAVQVAVIALGSMLVIWLMVKFRGPLSSIASGLGNIVKGFRHE